MAHTYPMMDWSGDDLGDAISMFRQKMTLYLEDEPIISSDAQARKICRGIGKEGLRRLNVSELTDVEKRRPENIWLFFESQLKKNINFRINRLNPMRYAQQPNENIDQFVKRAITLALKCSFTDMELAERMLELVIASTPQDDFRKDLPSKPPGYIVPDIVHDGRKHESRGIMGVLAHTPHPTRHVGPPGYVGPSGLPGYRTAYVNYPAYYSTT